MIKGQLKNGIKYVINHNTSYTSSTIIVFFKVGSRNEQKKYYGISHYIEHLLFKGTKNRKKPQEIVNPLYRYGARVNAFTDRDNTGYYVKIVPKHLDKALEILSDMLFNSLFREKDLQVEKKVVLNELERFASDPEKQIDQMITKLLYHDTTLEHDIGGTKEDIMNYTHDMVMSYLLRFYIKENIVISIAGKTSKDIIKKLNKYFGQQEFHYIPQKNLIHNNQTVLYPNLRILQNGVRFNNIIRKDLKQAYVTIGVPTYSINDERSFTVDIIGTILAGNMASRLFIKLREKLGLVYTVRKDIDKFEDCGSLKIVFSTFNGTDSIKKCYSEVIKEFDNLMKNKVSKKELQYAKDYLIGTINLSQENTKSVAMFIGQSQLFMSNPLTYEELIKKYKKVSSEDIYNVANEIFNINKTNLSIISKESLFD